METLEKPVQRGGKRRWTSEQKLALIQEWQNGLPVEEVSRRHAISAAQLYKWRRDMERGLAERGEMVPRSQVAALQKRVEELERALGRKALEVDVLKKAFELKGLKPPEGMSGG
jgi:transposase-like protein